MPRSSAPPDPVLLDSRRVLDAMPDLVLVKGPRSRLVWANRAFCDYYGMSAEALADLVDAPHSDPDDTLTYVREDHAVFVTATPLDIPSEPVTGADGVVRWFHTVKAPITRDDGVVVGTVGVSRPIPDENLRRSRARSRASHKRVQAELRALISNLPVPACMFDVHGDRMSANPSWSALIGPSDPDVIVDLARGTVATGVRAEHELHLTASHEVVDVVVAPWILPSGRPGGAIAVLHDLTERALASQRLQTAIDELTQFNYRVSHDLVAPLQTLRGLIDIASTELADGDPAMVQDAHERMLDTVSRLSGLVRDLMALARADLSTTRRPDAVELRDLVAEVVDAHQRARSALPMQVSIEGSARVRVEAVRVSQIVENLVSNAAKYCVKGEAPRIHVAIAKVDGRVVLEVADHGIGFDPAFVGDAFKMFRRGTAAAPGSGLGLYIVAKHVQHLRGHAEIVTAQGPTCVRVTFPEAPDDH